MLYVSGVEGNMVQVTDTDDKISELVPLDQLKKWSKTIGKKFHIYGARPNANWAVKPLIGYGIGINREQLWDAIQASAQESILGTYDLSDYLASAWNGAVVTLKVTDKKDREFDLAAKRVGADLWVTKSKASAFYNDQKVDSEILGMYFTRAVRKAKSVVSFTVSA